MADVLNSTPADFSSETPSFFKDILSSAATLGTSYLTGQQKTDQTKAQALQSTAAAAVKSSATVKAILIGAGALVFIVVLFLVFRKKG